MGEFLNAAQNDVAAIIRHPSPRRCFAISNAYTPLLHVNNLTDFSALAHDGYRLGTLCVLDQEPRKLREKEIRALKELAVIASDELKRSGKAE